MTKCDRFVYKQTVDVYEATTPPLDENNKEFIDNLKGSKDNTRVYKSLTCCIEI